MIALPDARTSPPATLYVGGTMTGQAQRTAGTPAAISGVAMAALFAAIFVVLTANTGTTYHLFPLLIAAAPGALPRLLQDVPLSSRAGTVAMTLGAVAVVVAWITLVALDEMPHTTLIGDQPGGVEGEFVVFGLLGALAGGWWGTRPV